MNPEIEKCKYIMQANQILSCTLDLDELLRRMKEENLDPEDYEWYIDLRRYGSVPHSGFGLGVERTLAWICKLEHIRDAVAFPRLINRVYP